MLYTPSPRRRSSPRLLGRAPQGSEADGDAMITLSVTADTHVPARRVALPLWFAAEFCAFQNVECLPKDPSLDASVYKPQADIDAVPRMLVVPSRLATGMTLTGTAEERAAFATASAALIFKTLRTVPRGVVPSLVLEYVVAPYATGVRCTMEQGMLGVTELAQTKAVTVPFGSGATPNLKKLTIGQPYDGPLPPSITSLVLYGNHPLTSLRTAPRLTSLALGAETSAEELRELAATPVRTVVRLSLRSLPDIAAGGEEAFIALIGCLGRSFPNVKVLHVDRSARLPAVPNVFDNVWPDLCELDAETAVAVAMARMRPTGWRQVTLRGDELTNLLRSGDVLKEAHLPDLLRLSIGSDVVPNVNIKAPRLQALYLEPQIRLVRLGSVLPIPAAFTQGAAPDLQHVSIDVPPTEGDDPRVRTIITDVAAAVGPGLRFITCRGGRVWGRSPNDNEVWERDGIAIPPHLALEPLRISDFSGSAPECRPRNRCQCLLTQNATFQRVSLLLEHNTMYGVAVAPFLATPLEGSSLSSNGTSNDDITLNVTTDTEFAPRPVTLPLWFAKQFCSFSSVAADGEPADDSGDGGGENISATMWSPTCAVDRDRRISITARATPPVCGMSKVGVIHHDEARMRTPPVLGTDEERRAFAGASAHLVLSAHHAVPHNVVPALVFEHVLAPFVANACCSLEQSRVGVTSWAQDEGSIPYVSFPNLKRLELSSRNRDAPLQDSIESLVLCVGKSLPRTPGIMRHLRSLTLDCRLAMDELAELATEPLITLETLVTRSLVTRSLVIASDRRLAALLSECFPRIRALRCLRDIDRSDTWVIEHFESTFVWPELNTLDIAGSYIVDIVAARPTAWTHLTLRRTNTPETNRLTVPTNIPNVEYLFVGCVEAWRWLNLEQSVALHVVHYPRWTREENDEPITAPNVRHMSISVDDNLNLSLRTGCFIESQDHMAARSADARSRRVSLRRVTYQDKNVAWQRGDAGQPWIEHSLVRARSIRYERHEQRLMPSHADRNDMYAQRLYRDFLRDSGQLQQRFTPQHDDVMPFRLAPDVAVRVKRGRED